MCKLQLQTIVDRGIENLLQKCTQLDFTKIVEDTSPFWKTLATAPPPAPYYLPGKEVSLCA